MHLTLFPNPPAVQRLCIVEEQYDMKSQNRDRKLTLNSVSVHVIEHKFYAHIIYNVLFPMPGIASNMPHLNLE